VIRNPFNHNPLVTDSHPIRREGPRQKYSHTFGKPVVLANYELYNQGRALHLKRAIKIASLVFAQPAHGYTRTPVHPYTPTTVHCCDYEQSSRKIRAAESPVISIGGRHRWCCPISSLLYYFFLVSDPLAITSRATKNKKHSEKETEPSETETS